jgi:hypothetical protein
MALILRMMSSLYASSSQSGVGSSAIRVSMHLSFYPIICCMQGIVRGVLVGMSIFMREIKCGTTLI